MTDLIHTEVREGFTINTYRLDEDMSPRGQFQAEDGSDDEELLADIESGKYDWFAVKVEARRAGVVLGADYLGTCCYETPFHFVEAGDYYDSMVAEAIEQAKTKLGVLATAQD